MIVRVKEDMTGWVMAEHGVPDSQLTVIHQVEDYVAPNGRRSARWLCQCSCGQYVQSLGSKIKLGKIKSCGCRAIKTRFTINANKYDLTGPYGIGFCNNTGMPFYFDLDDYEKIKNYGWYEFRVDSYSTVRAYIPELHKKVSLGQFIGGSWRDHKNRNPLDNRKENLREVAPRENAINRTKQCNNTSGFVGVYWHKKNNKWMAAIKLHGKLINLGLFSDKVDAICARLSAELKYFGEEFAPQRHLFKEYDII